MSVCCTCCAVFARVVAQQFGLLVQMPRKVKLTEYSTLTALAQFATTSRMWLWVIYVDPPAESEGVGGAMGVAGEARGRRSGGDENENRGKGDGNLLTRRGRRGSRARRDKNRETPLGRVAPRRSDGDGAGSRCREREHSRRAGGVETTRERGGFPTKSARRFCQKIRAGRARGGDATCERRTRNRDRVGRAVPIRE